MRSAELLSRKSSRIRNPSWGGVAESDSAELDGKELDAAGPGTEELGVDDAVDAETATTDEQELESQESEEQQEAGASDENPLQEGLDSAKKGLESAKKGLGSAKRKFDGLNSKVKIGIGVAFVAIVAVIAFVLIGGGGPSDSFVKQTIEENVSWPEGSSDGKNQWTTNSVEIQNKTVTKASETFLAGVLESDIYEYEAVVKGSSEIAEGEQTVTASFAKYQGDWTSMGCSTDSSSYTPKAGVSEEDIQADKDSILSKASGDSWSSSSGLRDLYSDGTMKVGDIDFNKDAGTCSATVSFTSDSAFSTAKAKIDVVYTFSDSATWDLESATAQSGADKVSYEKLIGTWKGKFKETSAGGNNCYGAESKEFTLTIDSIDEDSLKVQGTFQGLAHYHGKLDSDQNSTDGDTDSGPIEFVATLSKGFVDYGMTNACEVGASYEAPENTQGGLKVSFGFGYSDDPNAACAVLQTEANYTFGNWGTFTATFRDLYTLTKVE